MIRRLIDIIISGVALVTLAPLLVCTSFLVWIKEGSPVLFFQWRAGLGSVPFRLIKFRTMCPEAETLGGSLTYRADQRITSVGHVLRRFKLDELPQLFNVLRGEMTLVGPRPEVLDWVARYTPEQREVFTVKPGLTDPVQVLLRHEQDYLTSEVEYEKLFAIKVRKQIEYIRSRTAFCDVAVVVRTLLAIFDSRPSEEELAVYSGIQAIK